MRKFKNKIISLITIVLVSAVLFPAPLKAADGFVSIGLTKLQGVSSIRIESGAVNVYPDVYGQAAYTFESSQGFTISQADGGFALSRSGETLCVMETPFIQGTNGLTIIGGVSYRGYIKPVRGQSGMTGVNVVNVEQYLYGVVPAEMPALWSMEALKAQAVAARTYTYTKAGIHADAGYDLCDSTHCQAYLGTSHEHERSTDAVNQTSGVIAYYNGEPIDAVYSSSSGGSTENSENVWSTAVPYLRGVREVAENEFLEWTRTYTLEQLGAGLAANGVNIGRVVSVTAEYLPSGRLSKLTFNGSSGSKVYEKDTIRGFSAKIDGSLPSIMFKINGYSWSDSGVWNGSTGTSSGTYALGAGSQFSRNTADIYVKGNSASGAAVKQSAGTVSALGGGGRTNEGTGTVSASVSGNNTFTINSNVIVMEGRGNGHGVGMSQYGAKGMADAGYDYISILQHYYSGIEVR